MSLRDYAAQVYARPGVEELLLTLQDEHGQCVPLLLWAAWARSEEVWDVASAASIARQWHDASIVLLRTARRGMKGDLPGDPAAREALRAKVKRVELAAEYALLDALEDAGPMGERPVVEALTAAAGAWERPPPPVLIARLAELLS